jgi:ABC-2 type transport system ATP-binding protein
MIKVRRLGKTYGGQAWALRGLDLVVERGDLFGLIGPNGAGKTTLIKILATLLRPTEGLATIADLNVVSSPLAVRRRIGYLPDSFGVYEEMRVREYLEFFAASYGLRNPQRNQIVDGVLQLTDLGGKRDDLISALSRGMQQRLGLARVLVHDPDVLLLDEPASGLDPRARIEIRALLKELRRMGKTILISSHILADLADLCNKIGLIEKGRLLYAGGVEEAIARVRGGALWIVEVADDMARAAEVLKREPGVGSVEARNGQLIVTVSGGDPDEIPRALLREGLRLRGFRREDISLEEAFLRLTKGEVS